MERYGVAIHRDRLEAIIEEATERVETLKAEWGINPDSSKPLIEHFGLAERAGWPSRRAGSRARIRKPWRSYFCKALLGDRPSGPGENLRKP